VGGLTVERVCPKLKLIEMNQLSTPQMLSEAIELYLKVLKKFNG
jgi:hypothetical protein